MDYEKAYKAAKRLAAHWIENGCEATERILLTTIFPELKESEDERIRSCICLALTDVDEQRFTDFGVTLKDCLTYLEKQKEQKPVHTAKERWKDMRLEVYQQASGNRHEPNYSDDSTKMFSLCDIDEIFEKIGDSAVEQKPAECIEDSVEFKEGFKAGRESGLCDGQKYVLDNLDSYGLCKSAEWNAEDYEMLHLIINYFEFTKIPMKINICDKVVDFREIAEWLKSLRPQFHWRPSETQMWALQAIINDPNNAGAKSCQLALKSLLKDLKNGETK